MSLTLSTWLGIAFVLLAVIATVLQAWLWNPKWWDPVAKKTHAPRFWVQMHRAAGFLYAGIYVLMMMHMIPRLWDYQVELPARTVIHAAAGIAIGVILLTKILVWRMFRYFEEAMPILGMSLLVSTLILGFLSIPYPLSVASTSVGLDPERQTAVVAELERLGLSDLFPAQALVTETSLESGRDVLERRCTTCHDLRTAIGRTRTPGGWLDLVRRMSEMPGEHPRMSEVDVRLVTAYLVATSPLPVHDTSESEGEGEGVAGEGDEEDEPMVAAADSEPAEDDEEEASDEDEADAPVAAVAEAPVAAVPAAEPPQAAATVPVVLATTTALATESDEEESSSIRGRRHRRHRRSRGASTSAASAEPAAAAGGEEAMAYSPALGRALLRERCVSCHGMDDITQHGGDTAAGWGRVVRRMIGEGARLDARETRVLTRYLAATHPRR